MSIPDSYSPIPNGVIHASRKRRFLAAMIDLMLFPILFAALFLWTFPLLLGDWMLFLPNKINNVTGLRLSPHWYWFVLGPWLALFIFGVVLAFCSACCHASSLKATPGGRLMNIQVVDHKGKSIGFWHAFVRQFALRRPMTFLTSLLSTRYSLYRQGRHDYAYSTFVIYRDVRVLNHPPQPEPKLLVRSMTRSGLILLCGIIASICVGIWGFQASRDWLDAKQTVLLHEHHELVELLTQHYHDHEYEDCPKGEGIDAFTEDHQKQTISRIKYFRDIQFTSSYKTCMLTAKLHTPWDSTLDGTLANYGISANQTTVCDSYFQHASEACKVSTDQHKPNYRLHKEVFRYSYP